MGTGELPSHGHRVFGLVVSLHSFPFAQKGGISVGRCVYAAGETLLYDKPDGVAQMQIPINHPVRVLQDANGWIRVASTCVAADVFQKDSVLKWLYRDVLPAEGWVKTALVRGLTVLKVDEQNALNEAIAYMTSFNIGEIVRDLIGEGAQVELGPTPPKDLLSIAISNDGLEAFETLTQNGAKIKTLPTGPVNCSDEQQDMARTHLTEALASRSMRIVGFLIDHDGPLDVEICHGPILIES